MHIGCLLGFILKTFLVNISIIFMLLHKSTIQIKLTIFGHKTFIWATTKLSLFDTSEADADASEVSMRSERTKH